MWIPGEFVFLAAALFVVESGIIFAYTAIGLIKSNPSPLIISAPVCPHHCPFQYTQAGPNDNSGVSDGPTETTKSATPSATPSATTIYQTICLSTSSMTEYTLVTGPGGAPGTTSNGEIPAVVTVYLTTAMLPSGSGQASINVSANATATTPISTIVDFSSTSINVVSELVLVTTTIPASSAQRPTITVTEVVSTSAK